MPSMESFTTFSGIMAFFATIALLRGRFTIGATILIIAGTGGVAIFWDRWSREAGPHVQVQAFLSPVMPTFEQFALLATHLPMLIAGLVILAITTHRASRRRGSDDAPGTPEPLITAASGGDALAELGDRAEPPRREWTPRHRRRWVPPSLGDP